MSSTNRSLSEANENSNTNSIDSDKTKLSCDKGENLIPRDTVQKPFYRKTTLCVGLASNSITLAEQNRQDNAAETNHIPHFGSISYPIYQSATFAHPRVGQSTGYDYSRTANPTRTQCETMLANLENANFALTYSSGMAAISTIMELFSPGDRIIASDDLYGGSMRLFDNISLKNKLDIQYFDTSKPGIESLINQHTKAIFVETPTNPMMKVTDIFEIAEITRKHGILLIVDNTFLTPYLQNPLDLGADLVVHSATKYLSGHNDIVCGVIMGNEASLFEKLDFITNTVGANLAPFDSWLLMRGLKTLGIRLERQEQNALEIAQWLTDSPAVSKVYYTGIPSHPGYEIMKKQARGFGAMISFDLGEKEKAIRVLNNLKLISYAESLGGVESLMTYPTLQTHPDVPEEIKLRNGITESLLRLSVGIEDIEDLLWDLAQAFSS